MQIAADAGAVEQRRTLGRRAVGRDAPARPAQLVEQRPQLVLARAHLLGEPGVVVDAGHARAPLGVEHLAGSAPCGRGGVPMCQRSVPPWRSGKYSTSLRCRPWRAISASTDEHEK